ncbi:hypothetical protein CCAX7_58020 [Capsulimonas corticalis]|uniref:Uncharacterized protein n=1 Tax=Capsulimonas corticalis TaxID=2219043 RepID=A0A402D025_9BACT|nr:transglutaminase domain-containing protein [Capsulimonas corticalis]BDI33751.1 hypothetical protein CCAX7_58020 [Capsulimonas corticalis]
MTRRFYAALAAAFALCSGSRAFAADIDRCYSVSIDGKAVGYDHFLFVHSPAGAKATDDALIKLSALGSPLDISTQSVTECGPNGAAPLSYTETTTRGDAVTVNRLRFGKQTAYWSQESSGVRTKREIALTPGVMLVAGTDSWDALLGKTTSGMRRYVAHVVDPTLGKSEQFVLTRAAGKPGDDEVWASTIETVAGPQPIVLRYRRAARTLVEIRFPNQKVVMRLAGREALKNFGSLDYTSHMFAVLETPLPNPDALTVLKLKVSAKIKLDHITLASLQHAPRQTFQGTVQNDQIDGVFTIRPGRYAGAHALAYPCAPNITAGQSQWLKADAFTESDDAQIKTLAKTITAPAKTTWDAASAIGRWVHDNIRYQITGSGARACLASRTGDCGPHSWLSIALCRAAGIPARIQGGALYTPLAGGSYAQHYWTEVWMGPRDGWIPIDSTTGEIGTFDPDHLTLWRLGSMDSMTVKVLDYAPKTATTASAAPALPRRANGLTAGYHESYDFLIDGKNVGAQTAALESLQNGAQHWTFRLDLKVPSAGQTITLTQSGSFDAADTGDPVSIDSATSGGGISQETKLSFKKDQATGTVTIGTLATPKTVALSAPSFLFLGNVLTTWSLATRSITLAADKPTTIPFFATEALQSLPITFTPLRADIFSAPDGKTIPCHVYTIAPIGSTLWIDDATGQLMKLTDDRQKLVVALK